MKKSRIIFILSLFLLLSACGSPAADPGETATPATQPEISTESSRAPETEPAELPAAETFQEARQVLPLPAETVEFQFLSGAGGWSTVMTLNRDGSFSGWYHDSEMGLTGEAYPHGSVYVCSFYGAFADFERINEYTYKMRLTDLTTDEPAGKEWIDDQIRYIASDPFGMEEGENFILYLPETPVAEVPEEFLIWWPYRYEHQMEPMSELSCYGILNVTTNYGFFYIEEKA